MIGQREKELTQAFNRVESALKRCKPGCCPQLKIALERKSGNLELHYQVGTATWPDDTVKGVSLDDVISEWVHRCGFEDSQKQLIEPPAVASDDFTEI